MDYFEEWQTGSIYSVRELGRMLRSGQLEMREVARRFKPLPDSTCLLLEEAETAAANAEEQQERGWSRQG